jgi:5'-methylthioadenosine phosphorylase
MRREGALGAARWVGGAAAPHFDSSRSDNRHPERSAQRGSAATMIGVFGGSGFYSFLENVEETRVNTPFGAPSDAVMQATIAGRRVAFLPRHGRDHRHPAPFVNYRANLWAFRELGVTQILAPCACGSLQAHIHPGDFVILDQFVDRTSGRRDTFFEGPVTHHIGAADPYCPRLSRLAAETAEGLAISVHKSGTMVVIQGPRFSTRAESAWFTKMGWDVVGMTQYPEAILARELGICYTGIALVTDYDVGVAGIEGKAAVSIEEVFKVFNANLEHVRGLIVRMIEQLPEGAPSTGASPLNVEDGAPAGEFDCGCAREAVQARLG